MGYVRWSIWRHQKNAIIVDNDNEDKELFGVLANMSAWWTATWKRRIPRPGQIYQEEAIAV